MHLHNTSQYAIRILNFLANNDSKLLSAKELSTALEIPYKFLTKIMTELAKSDFVLSVRGRDGGFKLSRPAEDIKLMEILNTFNQFNERDECLLGIGKCDKLNKCSLHDKWEEPKSMIETIFKTTTLKNLTGENYKI